MNDEKNTEFEGISNRIQELRQDAGGVLELAELVGVSRHTIASAIAKRSRPNWQTIVGILRAYPRISEQWFFFGTPPKHKPNIGDFTVSQLYEAYQKAANENGQLRQKVIGLQDAVIKLQGQLMDKNKKGH